MENAKVSKIPMSLTTKMEKDEKVKNVDQLIYRGMIGSLLYLISNRPNIHFSVCIRAWFQSNPKELHLKAVKKILKYILGTQDIGLWYPKDVSFDLMGFSDANYAGSKIDRKCTSGTCHFLGQSLVSWSSKKQNSVALSTAEAEYIATGSYVAQVLWIKQQLEDFDLKFEKVPIKCDNTSAINLSKYPIQHSRTKHLDIQHHFIRDHVQKGDILIEYILTENQLADIFTKPLMEDRFSKIRRELGMMDLNCFLYFLVSKIDLNC